MAHFVKLTNGTLSNVIVVADSDCGGGNFPESEPIGQAFIASLGIAGEWLQTSYNNNFRGLYASGKIYNADLDEFIAPVIEP